MGASIVRDESYHDSVMIMIMEPIDAYMVYLGKEVHVRRPDLLSNQSIGSLTRDPNPE